MEFKRRESNRCFSVIICLALLFTLIGYISVETYAAGAESEREGYIPISSVKDLASVKNNLSGKYYLTTDIVFTEADFSEGGLCYNDGEGWQPIGDEDNPFSGILDGNGHTITGLWLEKSDTLHIYSGLFGYVIGGTIKDLGIKEIKTTVEANGYYPFVFSGSVAGRIEKGSVINCYASGSIMSKAGTVKNDISIDAGSIVGSASDSDISNCYSSVVIDIEAKLLEDDAHISIGGIVGSTFDTTFITECSNTGSINVKIDIPTSAYSFVDVGGIVGWFAESYVSDCYNTGIIMVETSSSSRSYETDIGGIAGISVNGSTIDSCYNVGSLSAIVDGVIKSGGITGEAYMTSVTNCYNMGSIVSEVMGVLTDVYFPYPEVAFGGITGSCMQSIFENCYNTGYISIASQLIDEETLFCAGGIVGCLNNTSSVTYCYNIGTILTDMYDFANESVGGVVSFVGGKENIIKNCYYLDRITENFISSDFEGVEDCSIDELQMQETFVGFDFENDWTMQGNEEYFYPELSGVGMKFTKELSFIKVTVNPNKIEYIADKEELDVTGGELTLFYNDATTEEVVLDAEMVSNFDNSFVGLQRLTVTYKGKTTGLEVLVRELGDIDGDGPVTIKDAMLSFSYVAGKEDFVDYDWSMGDMDGNGEVSIDDAVKLFKIVSGK